MITIKNNSVQARNLAQAIIDSGKTAVFDLDGVLLSAVHRQAIFTPDHVALGLCKDSDVGALNLQAYRANSTAEKIAQDKTMALIEAVEILNAASVPYYVCTARVRCTHTKKLLRDKNINPVYTMARSGEHDNRRDDHLKTAHLLARFDQRQREQMVLIDDNLRNCKAVQAIGLSAIHVPFEGH